MSRASDIQAAIDARKLAADALVGKLVVFRSRYTGHDDLNGPVRVRAAFQGHVYLEGFSGLFAARLFKVVEEVKP